jgi:hypothetical protein
VLAVSGLCFLMVISIQPLLWHMQTGNFFEWGYRGEGFYWDRPQIMNVLFSFRRGSFIWTPFLLLAAISIFMLWRHDRTRAAGSLVYWSVNVYVISSWWIWYYGSGFGSRVFIDHYPVMIIPLALVLDRLHRRTWSAARWSMVAILALHLVQFQQYHLGIIHPTHMDGTRYFATFLRTDPMYRGILGGKWEVPPYAPQGLDLVLSAFTDVEGPAPHWGEGLPVPDPRAHSGRHVYVYDRDREFGITFSAMAGELPVERELWLEVDLMRYEEKAGAALPALAIVSIQRPDSSLAFYDAFGMESVPGRLAKSWAKLSYRIPVPALRTGEELRFYLWNKNGRGTFLLDDLSVKVWAVRPYAGQPQGHAASEGEGT